MVHHGLQIHGGELLPAEPQERLAAPEIVSFYYEM